MKYSVILLSIAVSILFGFSALTSGCKTPKPQHNMQQQYESNTNNMQSAVFNDEHYVWENFIFSTNQVKSANQK